MQDFTKVVNPGVQSPAYHNRTRPVPVFCKIQFKNNQLSITGVEGPKTNGDAIGGCGQITPVEHMVEYAEGWDPNMLARFNDIWDRWHLNDMRAGCEHQRALKWDEARIDPAELPKSHANRDSRGILAMWVLETEHPNGLLCKPCPECGYKYGSAWLFEQVPDDVLEFLYGLPETKVTPAWV